MYQHIHFSFHVLNKFNATKGGSSIITRSTLFGYKFKWKKILLKTRNKVAGLHNNKGQRSDKY